MDLGEWNNIKVSVTPTGEYTIVGVTESQIQISLNGVVQPDCSKKQIYHAKYGDVAVMAAHWNWATPSNAHLRNLKIKSWDATPPGEPIFQGKMVKTLQNVKESWRLSFDLLKTQEPTEYYSNFLTFSSKCMEEQNRAASLWQGGSTTYFSVNCNDTDPSLRNGFNREDTLKLRALIDHNNRIALIKVRMLAAISPASAVIYP